MKRGITINSIKLTKIIILAVTAVILVLIVVFGIVCKVLNKENTEVNTHENRTDSYSYSDTVTTNIDNVYTDRPIKTDAPVRTTDTVYTEGPYENEYLFNSDSQLISVSYLSGLSQAEVRLILNEIYARNGYIFKTEEYIDYFTSKDWYEPKYEEQSEAEAHFNSIERENKDIIAEYEKSKGWR